MKYVHLCFFHPVVQDLTIIQLSQMNKTVQKCLYWNR